MPTAVILGSGTSNGVPMLGVDYPEAYLAEPKNHRNRCALLLEGPEGNVLVDCPPELRLQLLREHVKSVEAVIVTHTHADHVMGMDDLRSFCIVGKRDMPIYTLPRYQEDIRRIFAYAFEPPQVELELPRFDLRDAPTTLRVCGFEIELFCVLHGPWPVLALRVGDFAYVTDVGEIPPEAEARLGGLETLVLDAVRRRPHPTHFHFDKAVEVAMKLAARKTYFTHLSHDYDHHATNATLPDGIELAYDGLRIPL